MEINQKIAEFAEFEKIEYLNTNRKVCAFHWVSPENEWGKAWLPDFTDPVWGIALLFKWVVPKLNKRYDRHITLYQSTNGWTCDIGLGDVTVEDEQPALALCYAVEKLIDAQVSTKRTIKPPPKPRPNSIPSEVK